MLKVYSFITSFSSRLHLCKTRNSLISVENDEVVFPEERELEKDMMFSHMSYNDGYHVTLLSKAYITTLCFDTMKEIA